jgi:RNAse (barnase) inhibitor barstar
MEPPSNSPPWWHSLPHGRRYRKLQQIRKLCSRRHKNRPEARPGGSIHLDGTWIDDIPSFYLALGDAINGRCGYFGACLDSLSDCLCGGFGILPPLTIYLSRYDKVREALDGRAWQHFHAESTSYENSGLSEYGSYFEVLQEVLAKHGAKIIPEY